MTEIASVRRAAVFIAIALGVYLLQWGKDFLMPLVLALLLADVLRPGLQWLKKWRIGHALAVTLLTCSLAFLAALAIVLISKQVLDLTSELPNYQENLVQKIRSVRSGTGAFSRIGDTLRDLSREMAPTEGDPATQPVEQLAGDEPATAPAVSTTQPVPVQIVAPQAQTAVVATTFIAPILIPLGNAGVVFALLFFFLLEYDLMQHRIRWLLRQGNIGVPSATIREASERVARYLRMQLTVNVSSGVLVATAMWFMGVPNALLLGAVAGALRYIPYVGPLVGIALPTLLALAAFPDWFWPLMVLSVLLLIELITNMVLEPLLYGSSTGVSSTGVIIAFFFWGWTWGAMGLLMAMPMTVWLVVVGRYLPGVKQLAVMLSDESVASVELAEADPDAELDDKHIPGWHE